MWNVEYVMWGKAAAFHTPHHNLRKASRKLVKTVLDKYIARHIIRANTGKPDFEYLVDVDED